MYSKSNAILTLIIFVGVLAYGFSVAAQTESGTTEPITQETTVHSFSDASQIEGASARLTRYDNGVTGVITTNSLEEGVVYTLWWVAFNEPYNCSDGICNEDDLFVIEDGAIARDEAGNRLLNMDAIETAQVSVQHAAGGYAVDGTFHTSASLGEGDVPGIVFGPGLTDAQTAEVHLVIRSHGEMIEGEFADQISTFGGGCDPIDVAPCDDVQFAVFQPVVR